MKLDRQVIDGRAVRGFVCKVRRRGCLDLAGGGVGAGCCCTAVCNHKWKNKIGSAAQDVSHPPARPRPPVGTRGKTLICFVSLEQNERLLANRV